MNMVFAPLDMTEYEVGDYFTNAYAWSEDILEPLVNQPEGWINDQFEPFYEAEQPYQHPTLEGDEFY